MDFFQQNYEARCQTATDINEHLPALKRYADTADSILELGHRKGHSASAFLVSQASIFHSVDVKHCPSWEIITQRISESDSSEKKEFKYFQEDSLSWSPERKGYDLVFIDTLHDGPQLLGELCKYQAIATNWIIIHDTKTFAWIGESDPKGLRWALIEFLLRYFHRWRIYGHTDNNNGLTVLQRRTNGF